MMPRALRNAWLRLSLTHVGAVLFGIAAGALHHRGSERPPGFLTIPERAPQLQAATLAYRFGPADQARALLESSLRELPTDELAWGDVMMTRVRLAALDGEQARPAGPTPQLEAAADACRHFRGPNCSLEQLRGLAEQLAALRQ